MYHNIVKLLKAIKRFQNFQIFPGAFTCANTHCMASLILLTLLYYYTTFCINKYEFFMRTMMMQVLESTQLLVYYWSIARSRAYLPGQWDQCAHH